jgi:transcriptional regulator with XRE-family HTH domain
MVPGQQGIWVPRAGDIKTGTGDFRLAPVRHSKTQGVSTLFPVPTKRGEMSSEASRLAEFLKARRSQVRPEDVGYPRDPFRRVQGLRREEVADLAGISLEYYTRLEQGRAYQPSDQVLAGLARALRLDATSTEYLYRVALPAPPVARTRKRAQPSDQLVHLIDQWSDFPVYVFDRNQDIVVTNWLARALFPTLAESGYNNILAVFAAPTKIRDVERWRSIARGAVAALRFQGDPADPRLQEIVGELSVRDADFREMWADHEAKPLSAGSAPLMVEGFGTGEFDWQILNVPDGLFMMVWLASPGGFADAAFEFLRRQRLDTVPRPPVVETPTLVALPTNASAENESIVKESTEKETLQRYLDITQMRAESAIDEAS